MSVSVSVKLRGQEISVELCTIGLEKGKSGRGALPLGRLLCGYALSLAAGLDASEYLDTVEILSLGRRLGHVLRVPVSSMVTLSSRAPSMGDTCRNVRLRDLRRNEKSDRQRPAGRPQAYLCAISIAVRTLVQPVWMPAQSLQLAQHDLGR
jgi:hypothetical protein